MGKGSDYDVGKASKIDEGDDYIIPFKPKLVLISLIYCPPNAVLNQ